MEFAPIEGKDIFITGGAGFIGSTLAGLLLDRGNKVTVFDNFSRDSMANKSFKGHPNLKAVKGDILDPDGLRAAMGDPHMVVHCAAIAGIDTVIKSPITTMRTNMLGSANVLEACSALKRLERAVFFSTSEVFGQNAFRSEESHSTITGAVGEARWTYAISKLAEEHLAHAYFKERGMPVVTVRPFNVYGPGQVGEGAIKIFIQKALKDETIEIHGDGSQIRAWCYVDDLVRGIGLALTSPKAIGETFNLGNARAIVTIYGLANTIVRVLGSKSKILFSPKEYADVELRIPSIKKSKALLGFEAEVDLEDGILRTAEYYRRHP
jgi:UDP-glucose 4-epimerase